MGPCALPARKTLRLEGKTYEWGSMGRGGDQPSKALPEVLFIHTPSSIPGDQQTEEDPVRSFRGSRMK